MNHNPFSTLCMRPWNGKLVRSTIRETHILPYPVISTGEAKPYSFKGRIYVVRLWIWLVAGRCLCPISSNYPIWGHIQLGVSMMSFPSIQEYVGQVKLIRRYKKIWGEGSDIYHHNLKEKYHIMWKSSMVNWELIVIAYFFCLIHSLIWDASDYTSLEWTSLEWATLPLPPFG